MSQMKVQSNRAHVHQQDIQKSQMDDSKAPLRQGTSNLPKSCGDLKIWDTLQVEYFWSWESKRSKLFSAIFCLPQLIRVSCKNESPIQIKGFKQINYFKNFKRGLATLISSHHPFRSTHKELETTMLPTLSFPTTWWDWMSVMPWILRPEFSLPRSRANIISFFLVWVGKLTSKFNCKWKLDRPIGRKSEKRTPHLGTLWPSIRHCNSLKAIKFVWFTYTESFTMPMETILAILSVGY